MSMRTDAREHVVATLHGVIGEILPGLAPGRVVGQVHLKDLGADSVDRVEIILLVLERLGLNEPMSEFSTVPNLDALADLLVEKGGG